MSVALFVWAHSHGLYSARTDTHKVPEIRRAELFMARGAYVCCICCWPITKHRHVVVWSLVTWCIKCKYDLTMRWTDTSCLVMWLQSSSSSSTTFIITDETTDDSWQRSQPHVTVEQIQMSRTALPVSSPSTREN